MKTINNISLFSKFDSININYMVYEKNDDGLLLICEVAKNGKNYNANFSIDFNQLNTLISSIPFLNRELLTDLISSKLLSSSAFMSELDVTNELGKPIALYNYTLNANIAA